MPHTGVEMAIKEMPQEILSPLKLLADDTRLAIVLTLLKRGDMTFSQLLQVLKVPRNVLSHHLRLLVRAALVRNYYVKKEGASEYSFYGSTSTSKDFVDGILGTLVSRGDLIDILADYLKQDEKYRYLDDLSSFINYEIDVSGVEPQPETPLLPAVRRLSLMPIQSD
jgi:DNA-binding transcriptional ArsR family regulator